MTLSTFSYSHNRIIYTDPQPGANYVNPQNDIVIGFENPLAPGKTAITGNIIVSGSQSLNHEGTLIICSDRKKIIFKPALPFSSGEKVTVILTGKLLSLVFPGRKNFEYSFTTSAQKVAWDPRIAMEEDMDTNADEIFDMPNLTVTINNNPTPGSLFISSYTSPSFLIITDKDGIPYWNTQINAFTMDFKKQPNGDLTYYKMSEYKHYEINTQYNVVNTYSCGNGYLADGHDLRLLNNGHVLLMAYDPEIVDMSHIIAGGNPIATVVGLIIQELDENKNVVFQWRSWDHIPITNALHENLSAAFIDYVHGNAIEIDNDSNLLLSSRHLDAITKINRTTGDVIWTLGGVENQFTFINDTLRFTYQHAVRRVANGNITIFDNGDYHTPQLTRAIEYSLDENAKTATLVWEYRHTPAFYSSYMGYVQRLSSGNTLIGWGGANPTVTEVTPSGTIVFEMTFPAHIYSYRAYKFDWNGAPVSVNNQNSKVPDSFNLYQNYPNPFNPSTVITFDIPKASYVDLSVFDVTGRELKKLDSGFKKPGSYSVSFDGAQYSSGLYFCRLTAGDFTDTKKMILVK
jgi:hypothetical protein